MFAGNASLPPASWGDQAPCMTKRSSKARLHPGRKLGKDNSAKAFGTTRIYIRQGLAHVASRCIGTPHVNHGAFGVRPAVEKAPSHCRRHVVGAATVSAAIDCPTPPPGTGFSTTCGQMTARTARHHWR